ncbi:hypothetical protein [Echinicola shivajiensis]|uniref:hypothetical protein n=1 Tax=Echinicola shivajiensis TaxID=1035916 RepID=UPI001BFCA42E|nr:hypothetical protein [Echinicola shivajiensis]
MNKKCLIFIQCFLLLFTGVGAKGYAQEISKENYSPYDLLSSYYEEGFEPFKKGNFYTGLSFSLTDRKLENTDFLIQKVIDGEHLDYDVTLKGGYYTGDYGMVGVDVEFYQDKFTGITFQDPDSLQSNRISRGLSVSPNFRSSVPLTNDERLSFFTVLGVTFGGGRTLSRKTKNLDEIEKVYGSEFNFRVGLSPGLTFFVMEAFAIEVQLDVLGYDLKVTKNTMNNTETAIETRQNIDFNINLLSLDLGLAYYFGAKSHKY